jgi:hypothetical protein
MVSNIYNSRTEKENPTIYCIDVQGVTKKLYRDLSKVVHSRVIKHSNSNKNGDSFLVFPEYDKDYFNGWYEKFRQANYITSLFLAFSFSTLEKNLDKEKWKKSFPFDKSTVQGKT